MAIQKIKFKKYAKNIVVINWIATLRAKLSLAMTVEEPVWINYVVEINLGLLVLHWR